MRSEIHESPALVRRLLDRAAGRVEKLVAAGRARGLDLAVIAARGTPDHAALFGDEGVEART